MVREQMLQVCYALCDSTSCETQLSQLLAKEKSLPARLAAACGAKIHSEIKSQSQAFERYTYGPLGNELQSLIIVVAGRPYILHRFRWLSNTAYSNDCVTQKLYMDLSHLAQCHRAWADRLSVVLCRHPSLSWTGHQQLPARPCSAFHLTTQTQLRERADWEMLPITNNSHTHR